MSDEDRSQPLPTKGRTSVLWSSLFLVIFGVAVLAITLTPEPVDKELRPAISQFLAVMHDGGVPEWFGYSALEFAANIVLFIPLAFLISMIVPFRHWWLSMLIGPSLSIAIEVAQAAYFSARFASSGDVIANSAGAVIGAALAWAVRVGFERRALRQAQRPSP